MNIGERLTGRDKKHMFQKLLLVADKNLKFPMVISEKFDGVFCAAMMDGDRVVIMSRTGEEYMSMEHIKPYLAKLFKVKGTQMVLFEAYIPQTIQSTISGAVRDTKDQHEELKAAIYGIVDADMQITFSSGEGNRFIDESLPYFYIYHSWVKTKDDMMDIYRQIIEAGGEGIVLCKDFVQPYQAGKRNKLMQKLKNGLSYDLLVTGIVEGQGKYEGTLGALKVRFKDGKTVTVSGMTDLERKAWWRDPSQIIGRVVQIDAMTLTKTGTLREPRFKGVRHDKVEADY